MNHGMTEGTSEHNRSIFVVMPAYNEANVLADVLTPLVQEGYSVVVVDDGSKDATFDIARHFPVYVLRHPINLGQGAALQTGITFAVQQKARIIISFDADGQHRAADIPRLIQPILEGQADVVLGSRFLRSEDAAHVPFSKRVVLRGGVVINGLLTGLWLTDAHNGFRAFSHDAAARIRLQENGYAHASEILTQIGRHKLRYVEFPVTILYDQYALTKGQPISNSINILIDMLLHKVLR